MSSEIHSTQLNAGASATGVITGTDTHSITSECRYGCLDPLSCDWPHEGCMHCWKIRHSNIPQVDYISERQAKAAARSLTSLIGSTNDTTGNLEKTGVYEILKKWSEQP